MNADKIVHHECSGCGRIEDYAFTCYCDGVLESVRREYVAVDALLRDEAVAAATAPWAMNDQDMREAIGRAVCVVAGPRSTFELPEQP